MAVEQRSIMSPRIHEYLSTMPNPIKITHLKEYITFASSPFAQERDFGSIWKGILKYNPGIKPLEATKKLITSFRVAGIFTRFSSPPLSETRTMEDVREDAVSAGELLTRTAMKAHGIDRIDFLRTGSATLGYWLSQGIADKLEMPKINRKDIRAACASSVIAFIDVITDPLLNNKNGAIASIDPAGYMEHPRHYQDLLSIATIFGDGNNVFVFNTGDFEPITWQIRIVPDGGVIRLKTDYEFAPEIDKNLVNRLNITFANEGENIAAINQNHIALHILPPEENDILATISNNETADHFAQQTGKVMIEELEKFHALKPNAKISTIIMHDPSKLVTLRLIKEFKRNIKNSKLPQDFIDSLPESQFLLDEMNLPNSTSATTPNKWQYLAEAGLNPEGYTMLVAPGIGSAIAVLIFKYVPK